MFIFYFRNLAFMDDFSPHIFPVAGGRGASRLVTWIWTMYMKVPPGRTNSTIVRL
jgi:hypothetical protein